MKRLNLFTKSIAIAVSLLIFVGVASAQDQALDPNAIPDHGIAAGAVGFQPDPFRAIGIAGGGSIDATNRSLGANCVGHINVQPDFRFTALTAFDALRFIFIADVVTADASLIIRDPNGDFHCNDNSYGVRHPTVDLAAAPAGDFNIWVGAKTARVFGDLYLTTRLDVTPGSTGLIVPRPTSTPSFPPTATPIPPGTLNYTLPATYGTEPLMAGFLPDPYWRPVIGGGALPVDDLALGENCAGYTGVPPAFTLEWSGVSARLRFFFNPVDESRDPALIVHAPNGEWVCDRNFVSWLTQPMVEFVNPSAGTYSIWVSDEALAANAILGTLYVTEKTFTPDAVGMAGTLPAAPVEGLSPSVSAFVFNRQAADPYAVPGSLGGGDVHVGEHHPDCPGVYTALPSFGFTLPDAALHLRFFFVPEETRDDPTLIVRMPDGRWYCNDDSFNSRAPTVDVIGNFSTGAVAVWVGSFEPDQSIPGTLYITRGSANPRDPLRPPPATSESTP